MDPTARMRRHRMGVLIGVGVLAVSACNDASTQPDAVVADGAAVAASSTTVPAAEPSTSTSMSSTTIAAATTTTLSAWEALPANVKAADWHHGTYESIGYSCPDGGNPDVKCAAPHRANYTRTWIGTDPPGVDFIDFFGSYAPDAEPFPPDSPYSPWMILGQVDDDPQQGLGHGIRVRQLDRAPPGLDIGGAAWIRLTISSLSAMDRAEATGQLVPTDLGYRIETGTEGDPLRPPGVKRGPTLWIESVVLVATNDTMSEWVISFNQPGTYAHTATYWAGTGFSYGLNIRFVRL